MSNSAALSPATRISEIVRIRLEKRGYTGEISPDRELSEVGLSSLDMVGLMLSIEAEFDVEIPQAMITPANFRSVSAIETLVSRLAA